jgi:hypothetical protein
MEPVATRVEILTRADSNQARQIEAEQQNRRNNS